MDQVCPNNCGRCCYGTDVAYGKPYPVDDDDPCPNLEEGVGCSLSRAERPAICNNYLCPAVDK